MHHQILRCQWCKLVELASELSVNMPCIDKSKIESYISQVEFEIIALSRENFDTVLGEMKFFVDVEWFYIDKCHARTNIFLYIIEKTCDECPVRYTGANTES
ncbi:hypothetical protein NY2A_b092R [Paramecium bursaria Chlorella virus NY2A]|uniref:Uncharacterized protein b092R n=1 Tax=Paramecium bursaria Chlorella virus NY2A TaxID=46021 RepID=A7IVW7_PBCVN|nr:hypothetical protein NY2A_b092R [Paramecium bursaria Chlorella virus NY2A]ABT14491.1 hypothetical protein NY2A_b092R [Paramecium bursaria Chlorella virus NY2A]